MDDLTNKMVLGRVVAYTASIEHQKRGNPHAHILLIFGAEHKLRTVKDFDRVILAEIPDPVKHPELHKLMVKHMIHADCERSKGLPCSVNGTCKYGFPQSFQQCTVDHGDGYPLYRRRSPADGGQIYFTDSHRLVTNRNVVSTNPALLLKYNCHINVQICLSSHLEKLEHV